MFFLFTLEGFWNCDLFGHYLLNIIVTNTVYYHKCVLTALIFNKVIGLIYMYIDLIFSCGKSYNLLGYDSDKLNYANTVEHDIRLLIYVHFFFLPISLFFIGFILVVVAIFPCLEKLSMNKTCKTFNCLCMCVSSFYQ